MPGYTHHPAAQPDLSPTTSRLRRDAGAGPRTPPRRPPSGSTSCPWGRAPWPERLTPSTGASPRNCSDSRGSRGTRWTPCRIGTRPRIRRGGHPGRAYLPAGRGDRPLEPAEFGFVRIPDLFATGSSLMPPEEEPDVAEIVRGLAFHTAGNFIALLTGDEGTAAQLQQGYAGGQGAPLRHGRRRRADARRHDGPRQLDLVRRTKDEGRCPRRIHDGHRPRGRSRG